jgi:hypothetical protein
MLSKIDNTIKYGKQHGGFGIQILYPGLIRPQLNETSSRRTSKANFLR